MCDGQSKCCCECNCENNVMKTQTCCSTPLTLDVMKEKIGAIDTGAREPNTCFYKLVEEVGELGAMMRKGFMWDGESEDTIKDTLHEEVIDVLYYAFMIAYLYDVDLEKAMKAKEHINMKKYERPSMFEELN